ncbi:polar growth protein [Apophysomyces sp. BC1034]|nr:polar growth protein [Apophysomyces sp. BC1015]KAG0178398.1 polar growth protein [Apophysomyces sp. BC1021]KAG0188769.1 polar growth protein [Apophysomyces sp. BC1034]
MQHFGIVYAIHNFEAENEDEINFNVGDAIVVLEKDDKYMDGWWQGFIKGRTADGDTGLFPMNYTSPEKPARGGNFSSTFSLEDEIENTISRVQILPTPENSTNLYSPARRMDRPEDWDTGRVADWLATVGLESVADNFVEQEITGDVLLDLTIDSLKELGISTYGKRYKIMHAINNLKDDIKHTEVSDPHAKADTPPSPIDSESLYQFPRRAPLPPLAGAEEEESRYRLSPMARPQLDSMRPISPQSIGSSNVSRSNTFNTMSSKLSSSSSATLRSGDRALDSRNGTVAPRRKPSHKSSSSENFDHPHSPIPNHNRNDMDVNVSAINTQATNYKLSVSSVESQSTPRASLEALQTPEHEGWLHKQSDKYKTWNKRWFVLKGMNLFYFKSPKDVRMKGIINLRGYRIIPDESIHAGRYCFKAQHDRERTFFFHTDTEESMRMWVKMLMKTSITRNFQQPVMSSNHIATVPLDVARRMRPRPPSVIMYKSQKSTKNNDLKMTMLQEVDEYAMQYKQTRESGIVYPTLFTDEQDVPEIPDKFMQYRQDSATVVEEEEDLIDPDRKQSNAFSVQSTASDVSDNLWTNTNYIHWINAHVPADKQVAELSSAFRDGELLILFLEGLSQKQIRRPPPSKDGSPSMIMLDNLVAAFKFMGREGVEIDGQFTIKDIFGGNESKIINMLDAIKLWASSYPEDE